MSFRLTAALALLFVALLGGCAQQTSRIDDASLTSGSISRTKKGIALVKIGAALNTCTTAAISLGTRDGNKFRDVTTLRVVGLNSPVQPAVAEVELDPGEYHVTGYVCVTPQGSVARVASQMHLSGRVESFASFSINAGEVVNAGFLLIAPVRITRLAATTIIDWQIAVRDWPIDELTRFKSKRPQLYAAMQTRLMVVTKVAPPTADQVASACEPHKKLQSEGKIQDLPPLCRPGAQIPGVTAPAGQPGAPLPTTTKVRKKPVDA